MLCACDLVTTLTQQRELNQLHGAFEAAVAAIAPGLEIEWSFEEIMGGVSPDQNLHITESNGETTLTIIEKDRVFAVGHFNGSFQSAIVKELKLLATVFVHQIQHVNLCTIDPLTGVYNRFSFEDKVSSVCQAFISQDKRRKALNYCLVLLDIDHFKRVNDNLGHLFGDEVLVVLGQYLAKEFRESDNAYRYGGEEFALILENTELAEALAVMERFREKIASHQFPQMGNITISVGITAFRTSESATAIIGQADRALYYAKEKGRNQCQVYEFLLEKNLIASRIDDDTDIELF